MRPRQTLGKYRIERRLASGGFADVYKAYDTIEGIPVALKIPHPRLMDKEALEEFRKEVRLTARLDHPNILTIKNATFIDGHFVIVYRLGQGTLADRLRRRISLRTALDFGEQMLQALAYAHRKRIVHCDVKPENFILFSDHRLRLTDFGIAKVTFRTLDASGSGTVGYLAPEQAMGRPSFRSDVFSLGLVLYRMFSGHLPAWPYEWPPDGFERLRRKLRADMIAFLRRAIEVDERKRFDNAERMLAAFRRLRRRALVRRGRRRRRRSNSVDWKTVRMREFERRFGGDLALRHACGRCEGPVSELMRACPWCGAARPRHQAGSSFPARCPRCRRGHKLDWRFCPWCHGPSIGPRSDRDYTDVRYTARCDNPECSRKQLMPFMRYCPWCRRKVRRRWRVRGSKDRCARCGWGVVREFWDFCPWCGRRCGRN